MHMEWHWPTGYLNQHPISQMNGRSISIPLSSRPDVFLDLKQDKKAFEMRGYSPCFALNMRISGIIVRQ